MDVAGDAMRYHRQSLVCKDHICKMVWIPSNLAVEGTHVRLLDSDGWLIKKVYPTKMESRFIEERARDHRTQRTVSDI